MSSEENLFIQDTLKLKDTILKEKNIFIKALPFSEDILPRKHPDKKAQDERKIEYEKSEAKKLLDILQPAAEYALLYGKQFHNECYYGQAKHVNRFLNKEKQIYNINLNEDLWTGCDNFWIGNDQYHKNEPHHHIGDCYFSIPINNINWKDFFTKIHCWGALSKLRSTVVSKAGYKKVSSLIEERDDIVVVEFSRRVIRTSQKNMERLALIAAAYNEPYYFPNLDKSCEEIIFGSKKNAKLALDFSNDEYPLNELLK